jgi:hypothetical protein
MQSGDGNFPPEHHTCGCNGCSDACFQMPENEHSAQACAEVGTVIRHTAVAKKVGNEKIAFSWNLRGGAQTQGHERFRKESPQSLMPKQTIDCSPLSLLRTQECQLAGRFLSKLVGP